MKYWKMIISKILLMLVLFWSSFLPIENSYCIHRRVREYNSTLEEFKQIFQFTEGFEGLAKLKQKAKEIGQKGSDNIKEEVASFLITQISEKTNYFRRATFALEELFPYLNSDLRRKVIDVVVERYQIDKDFIDTMSEFSSPESLPSDKLKDSMRALVAFVAELKDDEMDFIDSGLISEISLTLAGLEDSFDIDRLSKIFRHLNPDTQVKSIDKMINSVKNYKDEIVSLIGQYSPDDETYREMLVWSIEGCIDNNLKYFSPVVIGKIYDITMQFLVNGDELLHKMGMEIGNNLLEYISDPGEKRKLNFLLKLNSE